MKKGTQIVIGGTTGAMVGLALLITFCSCGNLESAQFGNQIRCETASNELNAVQLETARCYALRMMAKLP